MRGAAKLAIRGECEHERDAKDGGGVWRGEQTQYRVGDCAETGGEQDGDWQSLIRMSGWSRKPKGLIEELPGAAGFMCDVAHDAQIAKLFEELKDEVRDVAGSGAQRGVCTGRGVEWRVFEYDARRVSVSRTM